MLTELHLEMDPKEYAEFVKFIDREFKRCEILSLYDIAVKYRKYFITDVTFDMLTSIKWTRDTFMAQTRYDWFALQNRDSIMYVTLYYAEKEI